VAQRMLHCGTRNMYVRIFLSRRNTDIRIKS
jgi:hypothetical protein